MIRLRNVEFLASLTRRPMTTAELIATTTAFESFETSTLSAGQGWASAGIVYNRPPVTAYEDFETSSLGGGGSDFGWSGSGIVYSR